MKIGELSSRSGASIRSLRYYEAQGLLAPGRSAGGQRVYSPEHLNQVRQLRELFEAGFCSSVIRELLHVLSSADADPAHLATAFAAAEARLRSEKAAVEAEIATLQRLRSRFELAPDTHVTSHTERHDTFPPATSAALDHRDRRLR